MGGFVIDVPSGGGVFYSGLIPRHGRQSGRFPRQWKAVGPFLQALEGGWGKMLRKGGGRGGEREEGGGLFYRLGRRPLSTLPLPPARPVAAWVQCPRVFQTLEATFGGFPRIGSRFRESFQTLETGFLPRRYFYPSFSLKFALSRPAFHGILPIKHPFPWLGDILPVCVPAAGSSRQFTLAFGPSSLFAKSDSFFSAAHDENVDFPVAEAVFERLLVPIGIPVPLHHLVTERDDAVLRPLLRGLYAFPHVRRGDDNGAF